MKLERLEIRNFKGIVFEVLNFDGFKNVDIFAKNRGGKTSVADAYSWLISNKDSNNSTKFDIKRLDEDNNVVPGLEVEVEAEFVDPDIKLRKVYKEVWKKVQGKAEKEFDKNTTDYFIDDVPVSMKKYNDKMCEFVLSADIFLMLSNPNNFCSNNFQKWEKRREILFGIAGGISDDEIFDSSAELRELKIALGKKNIDDMRITLKSSLKNINEEIEKIPVQISENTRSIEEIGNLDIEDILGAIEILNNSKNEKQQRLLMLENGGQKALLKKQILDIEIEMQKIKNTFEKEKAARVMIEHNRYNEQIKLRDKKQNEIFDIEKKIERLRKEVTEKDAEIQKLRDTFTFENESTPCIKTKCPTCQQKLPDNMIESAVSIANQNKAEILTNINTRGKALKLELENGEKLIFDYELVLQGKSAELDLIVIEGISESKDCAETLPEYVKLATKRNKLQEALLIPDETSMMEIDLLKESLNKIATEMYSLNVKIAQAEQIKKANIRIEELKQKNIVLGETFAKDSRLLHLIELFIRTKINSVTEKINSKFSLVKFRLFNELVNGNNEECCECLFKGIPYNGNLNTEGKLNAGLECIKVLQEHYKVNVPIFMDNRESTSDLLVDFENTQLISLYVSKNDTIIRLEITENN